VWACVACGHRSSCHTARHPASLAASACQITRLTLTAHSVHPAAALQAITVEVSQGPGLPHKLINVTIDYNAIADKSYLGG
jgi:hypothetical protein